MSTQGHELEAVNVQGLKASLKKGGNIGIYNDCICSTASATAAKVTNTVPPSFSLTNKAKILVKFTYGINVANATLQVGENAAKPIFYQGSALDAGRVKAGMFVLMQYDGTNFNILGDIAKMDEYYKDLHAGLADNLFGETQTNDKFIFRPTAGIQDIESGEPPVGGGAIRKVEGNAVAWNQLSNVVNYVNDVTDSNSTFNFTIQYRNVNGVIERRDETITAVGVYSYIITCPNETGLTFSVKHNGNAVDIKFIDVTGNTPFTIPNHVYFVRIKPTSVNPSVAGGLTLDYVNVIDLTLLFGSGNEPSTVEAFESWLSQNIGLKSYYPYNAGELIPVKDYKVKSVGFNAWDEQWENAYYPNGVRTEASTVIGSKNQIPVVEGATYFIDFPTDTENHAMYLVPYDGAGNFIKISGWDDDGRIWFTQPQQVTIPSGVHYLRFSFSAYNYYERGICINLSYDDDKDGTYEPYEEHQVNIDVTKLYGKLNGSGDYVQVFPDGLKQADNAGTVRDLVDLKNGIANKKVGPVKLWTLTWAYDSIAGGSNYGFFANCPDLKKYPASDRCKYMCAKYEAASNDELYVGKDRAVAGWDVLPDRIVIRDTSYTDSTLFTQSLQDVVLYGELATPLTYTDLVFRENGVDIPVSEIKYAVDDYGTEEVLLGNDEDVVSVAPTMTIKYGINAADTIADLPHDYVSCKPQSLVDSEQRTARNNIGAASQHDMDVVKKQLELIDKKVENDYYVDLGLPSGLLWAKRNIFTGTGNDMGFAPTEYSYDSSFFSWGNKEAHNPISTTAFDYDFGSSNSGPYASTDGAKLTGNIPISQDAAREHCGEPWRMPTTEEFKELFDNCDFVDANDAIIPSTTTNKLITMNSTTGIRLKSKVNGNYLFFSCSGYGYSTVWGAYGSSGVYWSGSLYSATNGWRLDFGAGGVYPQSNDNRFVGFPIRPVM